MTLEEALKRAVADAVAEGFQGSIAELRAAVEALSRSTSTTAAVRADPELVNLLQLDYLTAGEAAKLLRIGRDQVYKLVASRQLRCTRFGKKQIFSRVELDRFMTSAEASGEVVLR